MKLLLCTLFVLSSVAYGAGEQKKSKLRFDFLDYDDRIYSRSKKSEIGQDVRLRTRMSYLFDEDTLLSLGIKIHPDEDSVDDVTNKLEIGGKHRIGNFYFSGDFDLNIYAKQAGTDTAGSVFGFDQDSEHTYITYKQAETGLFLSLFPFNFDGEVAKGKVFNTWDVTRIYEINGTPAAVSETQANDEFLADKTIPGIVVGLEQGPLKVYVGAGVSTFLFPTDAGFDLDGTLTSTTWNRTEDIGYKAGFSIDLDNLAFINHVSLEGEYVGHNETYKTGSLLKDAASVYLYARVFDKLVVDGQLMASRAGDNAYRVNGSGSWFEIESAGELIYSDNTGSDQNWLGKTDFALAGRAGFMLTENFIPYVLYRFQGKNFIFRERESAHRLRTGDDAKSHGGLHRVGLGATFRTGNFVINPEFEAMFAKNAVFTNSADIQQSRLNSSYRKNDYLLRLKVSYEFDRIADFFKL